ncbi:Uncharacterised protein [Arcanobacterium haemolyticum]|nr:Uncharacterised protein [Arcanobacterium haemolyticum]
MKGIYDTPEELALLATLYTHVWLTMNYVVPTVNPAELTRLQNHLIGHPRDKTETLTIKAALKQKRHEQRYEHGTKTRLT